MGGGRGERKRGREGVLGRERVKQVVEKYEGKPIYL